MTSAQNHSALPRSIETALVVGPAEAVAPGPVIHRIDRPARPLRLAIVRQQYRADGGAERFTSRLIAAMRQNRCEVTLITRKWSDDPLGTAIRCDPPQWGRLSRDWGFARAVGRVLDRNSFDLVQSNERVAGCDVYRAGDGVHRAWLAQRRRVQTWPARWLTTLSPYHAYVKRAERRVFESPRLRAVICNSRMVRDDVLRCFRIDAAKLHVIYNGVDTRKFAPHLKEHRPGVRRALGIPADAPAFVFVGSGFQRKGLQQAIDCLAHVPAAHLMVVGHDKRRAHFERAAARLGMANRTHFVGVAGDVGPYYGAADALILPTLYDPFPNVALEAMASGLPAAVSAQCGAAELVSDGHSGFVCDSLSRHDWVRVLLRLTDRDTAERMGREARRCVEPLTLEAMAERLENLYRELLT